MTDNRTLDELVMAERFQPIESDAPLHLVRPGQAWIDDTPRCYKCRHFNSNDVLGGRCEAKVKTGFIASHDMMPGDGCELKYEPLWVRQEKIAC